VRIASFAWRKDNTGPHQAVGFNRLVDGAPSRPVAKPASLAPSRVAGHSWFIACCGSVALFPQRSPRIRRNTQRQTGGERITFTMRVRIRAAAMIWCGTIVVGCASWQGPRIDPSGERIFICPNAPQPTVGGPSMATPSVVPSPGAPTLAAPETTPQFGNLLAPPVYPDPPATPPLTVPQALPALPPPPATITSPPAVSGTPTPPAAQGTPVVVPPAVPPLTTIVPLGRDHLRVLPASIIAPVGSEVVLKAAICRTDGRAMPGSRIEWYLDPRGVGQFGDAGPLYLSNLFSWWQAPRRMDAWRAVGVGAFTPVALDRGTADPRDDVPIAVGEGWITVFSATPGTSIVTAYTPALNEWNRAVATIQWVQQPFGSAAVAAPPTSGAPAIATRGGVAAPSPSPSTPAPANVPPQPSATPAPASDATAPAEPTRDNQTSRPQLTLEMRRTGPEQIGVGEYSSFELIVTNTGTATARRIRIRDQFDRGLSHPRARPNEFAVEYTGMRDLPPGETASIPLTFQAVEQGTHCHEVTVTADDVPAVKDRACVTARPAALDVTVTAPRSRVVGEVAEFNVVVKNVGEVAAQNVELVIRFDAALVPERIGDPRHKRLADGAIVLTIERLEAAERRAVQLTARCVSSSEYATVRATVTAVGNVAAANEGRVEILPAAGSSDL